MESIALAMSITIGVLVAPLSQAQATQTTASAAPAEVHARGDISGVWQGTYRSANAVAREVLRITKTGDGELLTMWYQIDNNGIPHLSPQTTLQGNDFMFTIEEPPQGNVSYHGKLSADGNSIVGSWKQGNNPPAQIEFVRATKETAWEIPAGPAPQKAMAGDADPSFSVATIKPSDPDAQSNQRVVSMSGLQYRTDAAGRSFTVRSSTLTDMIAWAYHMHRSQVAGWPKWADEEKFDIAAVQDGEGRPSNAQWRVMMQKLLVERFQLTFHHETRELAVYELTAGNGADKLANSPPGEIGVELNSIGPGGIARTWTNTTMSDFVSYDLQAYLGDKPVLDKTGLTDKYDFKLVFAPMPGSDEAKFMGSPKQDDIPAVDLFTALQKQLGLKLKAVKTMADVLVIDHIERPSEN
jgi:uncharacterized protein (TIGR03435 family)